MKKILTTVTVFIAFATASFAQTPAANGNLETWVNATGGPNGDFEDLPGPFIKTLNSLYNLPAIIGGPGPLTATKVTDVCEGTYAVQLTSKTFQGIFIPAALGTFDISLAPQGVILGKAYTDRPLRVSYCAKYTPVQGDSAEVFCKLTKWENGQRTIIGSGNLKHFGSTSSYANYSFDITYNSNATPDSIQLLAVASAGYDFTTLTNSAGQENSTLYIDNLVLDFTIGVEENLAEQTKIYPVPFTNEVNIVLPEGVKATDYKLIDITGRTVASGSFTTNNTVISTASLTQGSYWVEISGAKGILTRRQIQKF